MNDDDQDPMLGTDEQRQQYLQQINDMITQDVEQRRAQRIADFQRGIDSKAIILGTTGSNSFIGAVDA